MKIEGRVLKIVSIAVITLGLAALAILVAPSIHGRAQVRVDRPSVSVNTRLFGGNPQIGVSIRDVEAAEVTREKLAGPTGAVVEEVRSNSPAEKAGFKTGDVIAMFDGEKVRSARHLSRLVEETPDGREVNVTVLRSGEKVELKVTPTTESSGLFRNLGGNVADRLALSIPARPETFVPYRLQVFGGPGRLGAGVQDLSGQLGDYFGTKEGALVTTVDENSAARTAGLKAGDVITKINGQSVHNSAELRTRLSNASGEVTITILRDKKEQTLTAKVEGERSRRVIRRITRTV